MHEDGGLHSSSGFYPRDAMRRAGICDSNVTTVRPSVCLLQQVLYQNGKISSPSDSPMMSLSGEVWLVEKFARGWRGRFLRLGWVRTGDFGDFSTYKPPYLRNGARYDQCYYWTLIENCISAFDWYQNQRPWMTLNWPWTAITRFLHYTCLSEPTTKIWM